MDVSWSMAREAGAEIAVCGREHKWGASSLLVGGVFAGSAAGYGC